MRRLILLLLICLAASTRAASSSQDEQHFVASLHVGNAPRVRYLDADGRPLDYTAFALQLHRGSHYSITGDSHAGMAMLRLRPPGAGPGQPGRFAFGRGAVFPPFALPSWQGGMRRLDDFRGHYILISFFFAECAPCMAEVPTLNAYAREHGDMDFIAITYEDAATAHRFVNDHGLTWRVLYDAQALTDTLGIGIYPTLMLVDPSGHVAGAAVGMSMHDDSAKRLADLRGWIAQWKRATQ
ncbi:TlpA family protein disulfide reductase [Dyella jejuensis]|uniref:TlpA family protein disulfide reductase n=1 Tax=Dyella jejuensis TaxID=1432009 RepID=A0ABW8JJ18_9GAMM